MKILSIDTSTMRGSVCLLEEREVIGELRLFSRATHSERLLRSAEFLLASAGWALQDLNLIASCIGPGSFTGIRIGLATALGLAQSLHVPFAGVSGLDALALQAAHLEGSIGVIMDAQRKQVYFAEYLSKNGRLRKMRTPELCVPLDLEPRIAKGHFSVVGEGALKFQSELGIPRRGWPRLIPADLFLASSIGRIALTRRRTWQTGSFLRAEALYIRPPDAIKPKTRKT